MIDAADRIPRHVVRVLGHGISIAEAGEGPAVFLLHGNATYSYTWRNLIPYLAYSNRCIAPDLPGMGLSEPILPSGPRSYAFDDQVSHLGLLFELLEPDRPIVLVGHELGATMAIRFARQEPSRVAGLVLLEAAFRSVNDSLFDGDVRRFLSQARSEAGEHLILRDNSLVDKYLPRLTARRLSPVEMTNYTKPYRQAGESRRPMLSMIRQLPLQSSPGPIDALVEESRLWCAQSPIPKLVIGGNPGFLVPPSILGTTTRWAGTQVASVKGRHFLTEDSPARLTSLILDWLAQIGHSR